MNKILGYVIAAVGLVLVALSFAPIKSLLPFTLPSALTNTYLIIIGGVLVIVGLFMATRGSSGSPKQAEVPIYEGKNVVGYRRLKK